MAQTVRRERRHASRRACTKCHRRTVAVVPDWNSRQRAIETMLEQGYGKPRGEGEAGDMVMVVKRIIVEPGGSFPDDVTP